jgi:heterodisulfide reductase subunit A
MGTRRTLNEKRPCSEEDEQNRAIVHARVQKEHIMTAIEPTGSVMVIGGGIAGIQASLDLAGSGYLVHLVEKDSAIGGLMSQLDKTFPTNDCAM